VNAHPHHQDDSDNNRPAKDHARGSFEAACESTLYALLVFLVYNNPESRAEHHINAIT
jgi:hypothetical protein